MRYNSNSKETWTQIISAKKEYDSTAQPQLPFYNWMEETYGVKLSLSPNGSMDLSNVIVDQNKYLIFMLKHSRQ